MELPIALLGLLVVVIVALASPSLAAGLFVLACLVSASVATLAVLARNGRS
ncbi:MAG: hypothetical protein KC549_05560 [Myxococcales bacterium]|nr:hypothetical protein [Myxococcales bacterium]MCB9548845.1 hypothetical protein [Myxococcales bacterium]